jgi:ATP-dependent Clp protease ATP-binding subunit ClpB
MAAIVDIQLARLRKLLDERQITLELDDAAREWLAEAGYDPAYGARPLKRVIQQQLQNELAKELLSGRFPEGSSVRIDFLQDGFTFELV